MSSIVIILIVTPIVPLLGFRTGRHLFLLFWKLLALRVGILLLSKS